MSRSLTLAFVVAAVAGGLGTGYAQQKQKPTGNPPYVTVPPPPQPGVQQPGVQQPQNVCPCYRSNGVYAGYATAACCFRR